MLIDEAYSNKPCKTESLHDGTQHVASVISPAEIQHAINNEFIKHDLCQMSKEKHF
jgi:hypothetical protein